MITTNPKATPPAIKEFAVISDLKTIKLAHDLLSKIREIEMKTEKLINRSDNSAFQSLPSSTRINILKNMNRFLLSKNISYNELIAKWYDLFSQYLNNK